jgi:hypothetical protein
VQFLDAQLENELAAMPFAEGHGAGPGSLGGGTLYYAIAKLLRARVCVCLGSGGGFVPCIMRLAQRDLEIKGAETYLVDAILPEAGYGSPEGPGGWMDADSIMAMKFPEIIVLGCRTNVAAHGFFPKNRVLIDYLHIDADHSMEAVIADFEAYLPLLRPSSFVTMHDSAMQSVHQALTVIGERYPEFQRFDMPDLGAGLATLRRRVVPAGS